MGLHWKLAPAALAILLISAGVWWWGGTEPAIPPNAPLGQINGQPLVEGEWISAEGTDSTTISFDDGSQIDVTPGAKLRPTRLATNSVHLSLESGELSSQITPDQGIEWTFLAGPYRVIVVGTQLLVGWEPSTERLVVEVSEGEVRVVGQNLGEEGISVSRSQRLHADRQGVHLTEGDEELMAETHMEELSTPPAAEADGGDREAVREQSREGASVALPVPDGKIAKGWHHLAKQGRYADAVTSAEANGFEQLVEELPAWELLALADAARLSNNVDRAKQSLLGVRRRFPGQRPAQEAAFRLGRLASDSSGSYSDSVEWFRTVVREAPGSRRAGDARGRLIDVLSRLGRHDEAIQVARNYLEQHPGGTYESAARALVERTDHQ